MYNKDSVEIYQEVDLEREQRPNMCFSQKPIVVGNEAESKERISCVFVRKMTAKVKT